MPNVNKNIGVGLVSITAFIENDLTIISLAISVRLVYEPCLTKLHITM